MTSLFLWLSIIVQVYSILFQRGWANYSEIPPTKWKKHYQYGVKHQFGVIIEESKHREVIHYSVLHSSAVIVSLVKDIQRG